MYVVLLEGEIVLTVCGDEESGRAVVTGRDGTCCKEGKGQTVERGGIRAFY